MARYEGMEELLRRVSERMTERGVIGSGRRPGASGATEIRPHYADLLEMVLLLVRDASRLNDALPEYLGSLSEEQQADILALLGRVSRQISQLDTQLREY